MQKVIIITAIYLLLSGCTVLKIKKSGIERISNDLTNNRIVELLTRGNLSDSSYYIQKAEIEVITNNEKEKFIASWKFENSGRSLLSFRSRTGIEVARILITNDTVLINDRINRNLYYGSANYIRGKYDVTAMSLPLIIGDYIGKTSGWDETLKCSGGTINLQTSINGTRTNYIIDCKKGKVITTSLYSSINEKEIELNFSKFVGIGDIIIPSKISIKYYKINSEINIKIDKVMYPWKGEIQFIPGNKYEILELK